MPADRRAAFFGYVNGMVGVDKDGSVAIYGYGMGIKKATHTGRRNQQIDRSHLTYWILFFKQFDHPGSSFVFFRQHFVIFYADDLV